MRNIGTCSLFRAICPLLFGHARAALIISTGSTSTRQDRERLRQRITSALMITSADHAGYNCIF